MKTLGPLVILVLLATNVFAQISVDYNWQKVKHTFEPLSPLPPEKTFSIKLPDSLSYIRDRTEVRRYWSPYGLQLVNKWNEKTPSDYLFKFELDGITVLQTQVLERKSNTSATGKEFLRQYLVSFPSRIVIIDNATKQTIRTITVTTGEDTFVRTLNRYFFITDSFDPNYKREVGFDSLKTLQRIPETDGKTLRRIEGLIASDVIFEKIKAVLVSLYGKESFKAQLGAFNPRAKNRPADFSDFDTNSQKLIKAYELLAVNWNDESARKLLQEAEDFYVTRSENNEDRFKDYIPMAINYNLAEINLIQNDFEKADSYYRKAVAGKTDMYFETICKPNYEDAKKVLEVRHMATQDKVYALPPREKLDVIVSPAGPAPVVTRGYIVTQANDTIHGEFKEFEQSSYGKEVSFTDASGKEKNYTWTAVKFVSNEGDIYESVKGALVKLVYHSPSIQVYFVRQTGEYIYSFPKTGAFGTYKAFSRDDAANFMVNYNKKLAEVFKGCPAVVTKIESGTYDLKSEKAKGHIRVIGDYEALCGGQDDFEKTLGRFQPESILKSYK